MKFLTLTLLVVFSLSVTAYKVRKEPFTPSVGIIDPVADVQKLTTNYNEMVNQPDKKLISIGIPEHIDVDKNIVFGDRYEDVEYVKSKGKKGSKHHRFAKKQDSESESSEEEASSSSSSEEEESERQLDDLLEVEFQADVSTAEEAFEAVMRHQDQILSFIDEIAKEKEPNEHQRLVVKQLFKYVKLVQQAHDLLKDVESEEDQEFIAKVAASIHQYTIMLDEHKYNEERHDSTQKNLIGKRQKDNENLLIELDRNADRVVDLIDDGADGEFEQIVAVEHVGHQAQIACKVLQLRTLIDKVRHAHVEKNPQPQLELLDGYKVAIKHEKKLVNEQQIQLDDLDRLFSENEELTEEQIQTLAESPLLTEKSHAAARLALHHLDLEDEYQAEVQLELIQNAIRELIHEYAETDAMLSQQMIVQLKLVDTIQEGDMHEFEELLNEIIDETSEDQSIVIGDDEVTHLTSIAINSIKKHNYKMVPAQTRKIVEYTRGKEYPKPSVAKIDAHNTEEEIVWKELASEVRVLAQLTKAAKDLTLAEDRQQAEDFIEQTAGLTQQMTKIQKFRKAVTASMEAEHDEEALEAALENLDSLLETELANLKTDRDQMQKSLENVEDLAESSLVEEFEDSHTKALTIVEEENLNALARWSVLTAAQYMQLDVDYEVKVHLAKSIKYINADLHALELSIESVESQQEHLEAAQSAASEGKGQKVVEALEALTLEIQTEQPVCEVDVEVEANAENAMNLMKEGKYEEAVDAVNDISLWIVDPRGEDQETIWDRLEQQGEGNGINPDEALDITETNKSPSEVETENTVEQVNVFSEAVTDALEEEDKQAIEEAVEAFYHWAQRQYKMIDFGTTLNAVKKAEEVGADSDSYVSTLEDFKSSNEEEQEALKELANKLLGLKEEVQAIKKDFDEEANSDLITELNDLFNNQHSNAEIKVQIDQGIEFLEHDKRPSALESIETIAQRIEDQIDEVQLSIEAIDTQNELVDKAIEAAEDNDFSEILDHLEQLEDNITEGQSVILTDSRLLELLVQIQENIKEGAFGDVATANEEMTESLQNELEARRESDIQDPTASPSEETQEAQAEELERDVENAEEQVQEGSELEALEAVEHVEQETQSDAKVKLVEEVKAEVEQALDDDDQDTAIEATESLEEVIEAEKEAVEENKEEIEEVAELLEEVVEEAEDATPEEAEEEAEEVLEEVEEVDAVPAKVEAAIEEAQEDAEEGNVGDAEEKLEEALEETQEEEQQIEKSEEVIDKQVEELETAIEDIENGDEEKAVADLTNVADSVDEQPQVKISEDAEEAAEEAKEAIAEGNTDKAAEQIEEIVEAAEEEVEEQLEDAEIEVSSSDSEGEEEGVVEGEMEEEEVLVVEPFEESETDEELVDHINEVIKVLTPEDPAELDQDEALAAVKDLAEYAPQFEVQVDEIRVAIESDDYEGAAAQAEALLTFVNPTEEEEEEDDGLTKHLLPELEKRFSQKHTKSMKKAENRIKKVKSHKAKVLANLKKKHINKK